jgi:hypothetical protein
MFPILPTSRYHHLLVVLVDPPLNYTRLNGPGPPDVTAVRSNQTNPSSLPSHTQRRRHHTNFPAALPQAPTAAAAASEANARPRGSRGLHLLGRPNQDLAVLLRRDEKIWSSNT